MTKLSITEKRERAEQAKALLGPESLFAKTIIELRKRVFQQLLSERTYGPAAIQLHAKLQAIDDMTGELGAIINDYTSAVGHNK